MRTLLLFAWLLPACAPAPPRELTDEQRYRAALAGPIEAAPASCGAISAPGLRGDCQSAAAARFAEAGRHAEAEAQCDRIIDPLWRDECWFMIADAAGLQGAAAAAACRRAGRYHSFCRRHALQRAAAQVELPLGGEPDAIRRFAGEVRVLMPLASAEIVQHTANTLVAEELPRRWSAEPFDPALCGALTEPLCRHAYWYSATRLLGEMRTVCAAGAAGRAQAAAAAGLSGHTEAAAPIAEAVWADLCRQIASGALDPDAVGAAQPASLAGGLLPIE